MELKKFISQVLEDITNGVKESESKSVRIQRDNSGTTKIAFDLIIDTDKNNMEVRDFIMSEPDVSRIKFSIYLKI